MIEQNRVSISAPFTQTRYVSRGVCVALTGIAGALPSACDSAGEIPGGPPRSSSQAPVDMYGAPHVLNSLRYDRFVKAPCSLITPRQFGQIQAKYSLGIKAAPDDVPAALGTCKYMPEEIGSSAATGSVALLRGGAGLAGVYASRAGDSIFEPATIVGYPAVNQAIRGDEDSGTCGITVGLADNQALSADFTAADSNAPRTQTCAAATAMATAAVETVKANQ